MLKKANMLFQIFFLYLYFLNILVFCFSNVQISAHHKSIFDDTYEDKNSIEILTVNAVFECSIICSLNKRCVSFFFNTLTKTCILHRDPFIYTVITKSAAGWKFYITRDSKYMYTFLIFTFF